ncbi:hypothetical protein ACLOJK_001594 [Asimina triloba]
MEAKARDILAKFMSMRSKVEVCIAKAEQLEVAKVEAAKSEACSKRRANDEQAHDKHEWRLDTLRQVEDLQHTLSEMTAKRDATVAGRSKGWECMLSFGVLAITLSETLRKTEEQKRAKVVARGRRRLRLGRHDKYQFTGSLRQLKNVLQRSLSRIRLKFNAEAASTQEVKAKAEATTQQARAEAAAAKKAQVEARAKGVGLHQKLQASETDVPRLELENEEKKGKN